MLAIPDALLLVLLLPGPVCAGDDDNGFEVTWVQIFADGGD